MICLKGKKIHFIGAGGMGVGALAKFAIESGASVGGSDAKCEDLCIELKRMGADIYEGKNPDAAEGADIVVYSSAIKECHPELLRARELGIRIMERQEFLHEVASGFHETVGIAGTHGKTTTTAMLAHIMRDFGLGFVAMIGGDSVEFGNYVNNCKCDSDDIFLTEACEYKRNFLSLKPTVAVVTNVECDHPDSYESLESVRAAFDEYLSGAETKVYYVDGNRKGDRDIIAESLGERAVYHVTTTCRDCKISLGDELVCEFSFEDGCEYNYANAALAAVTASVFGVRIADAVQSLQTFRGVKRRFERAGKIGGTPVYFDFAHHPTEIGCVLERAAAFGKILAVFQPHTYSRTKAYFDDFVNVLGNDRHIGDLLIMPTYAAREKNDPDNDYDALVKRIKEKCGKNCVYAMKARDVLSFVRNNADGYGIILFIGAGDIYNLKANFVEKRV